MNRIFSLIYNHLPLALIAALVLLLSVSGAGPVAASSAAHVRWDIVSIDFGATPVPSVSEGGIASALASDGSMITLTGTGTFVAPAGGKGSSSAATGGGTWATSTGSGTYEVTGLVRWDIAPGTIPFTDLIGDPAERAAGLATLTIRFSDGDRGVLVVSCHLNGTPDTVFEGVTASKSYVDYLNPVAPPAPPGNGSRTLFHVEQ